MEATVRDCSLRCSSRSAHQVGVTTSMVAPIGMRDDKTEVGDEDRGEVKVQVLVPSPRWSGSSIVK